MSFETNINKIDRVLGVRSVKKFWFLLENAYINKNCRIIKVSHTSDPKTYEQNFNKKYDLYTFLAVDYEP